MHFFANLCCFTICFVHNAIYIMIYFVCSFIHISQPNMCNFNHKGGECKKENFLNKTETHIVVFQTLSAK